MLLPMDKVFVGITGASGHLYAERLLRALAAAGREVGLSVTGAGVKVLAHELGVRAGKDGGGLNAALPDWLGPETAARVNAYATAAVEAPPSSGTSLTGGVVICPCSMGTLARIAAGFSSNLVERAADVALKERRKLVLVPRETPLSEIHLENMLRLARMGAVILPAMPGFYHHPRTLDDAVDHVVGKVLDALGIEHGTGARWDGKLDPPREAGTDPADASSDANGNATGDTHPPS